MAGCEYLQNIERVGLKVALKLYEKHKTFEKVITALEKNPNLKKHLKSDYSRQALQTAQLFRFQTVFNPKSNQLEQLSTFNVEENLDFEFIGSHEPIKAQLG